MEYLVDLLYDLQEVRDKNEHHKEESVLSHSLQAMKMARKEGRGDKDLIVAAAFHDIGKMIKSLGHEKIALDILRAFGYYNHIVYELIGNHMRAHSFLDGSTKKRGKVHKFLDLSTFSRSMHLARIDVTSRLSGQVLTDERDYLITILEETNQL